MNRGSVFACAWIAIAAGACDDTREPLSSYTVTSPATCAQDCVDADSDAGPTRAGTPTALVGSSSGPSSAPSGSGAPDVNTSTSSASSSTGAAGGDPFLGSIAGAYVFGVTTTGSGGTGAPVPEGEPFAGHYAF